MLAMEGARTPRVLATSWGLFVQVRKGLSLEGRCGYDEERLGWKVVGSNPGGGKVFYLRNFH